MEETAMTFAEVISNAGEVVSSGLEWAGEGATAIMNNPITLFFCLLGLVGAGIGLAKRFLS